MLRKDVPRLVNPSPVPRVLSSAIGDPSDRELVTIGDPGRVGNDEGTKGMVVKLDVGNGWD
jgi:hypothetical protein